jgi:hypothetical protein
MDQVTAPIANQGTYGSMDQVTRANSGIMNPQDMPQNPYDPNAQYDPNTGYDYNSGQPY